MKFRISGLLAIAAFLSCLLGSAHTVAQNAYITTESNTVLVINTATNTITATIHVGSESFLEGVAASPDGSRVYITNPPANTVWVIDTATNAVIAAIPVISYPEGVAVSPDSSKAYVTDAGSSSVSVIATATNTVTATIPVTLFGAVVTPIGVVVGAVAICVGI